VAGIGCGISAYSLYLANEASACARSCAMALQQRGIICPTPAPNPFRRGTGELPIGERTLTPITPPTPGPDRQ
jgi:hypothetical protein